MSPKPNHEPDISTSQVVSALPDATIASLEGLVVTRGTGLGIAGLQVFLHADEDGRDRRLGATITDAEGRFAMGRVGTVKSIEISSADAAESVIRSITRRRKMPMRFELSAGEIARLLPQRDLKRKEQEERWERDRVMGREAAHSRGVRTIEKLQRQQEFGARIATQIATQIEDATVRRLSDDQDDAYVAPDSSEAELRTRLLDVGKKGLADAAAKHRRVDLDEETLATLEERVSGGHVSLEDVLAVSTGAVGPAVSKEALDVLATIRDRLPGPVPGTVPSALPSKPGEDPTASLGDEDLARQHVREAIERLHANQDADQVPTAASEVEATSMKGGPADVTSYHEFRDVRIAFDPLWTQFYDKELWESVSEVVGGLARFDEDLPFDEVNALEELLPILAIADRAGADVNEPPDRRGVPAAVRLISDVSSADYSALSSRAWQDLDCLAAQWKAVSGLLNAGYTLPWGQGSHGWYHETQYLGEADKEKQFDSNKVGTFWRVVHGPWINFDGEIWVDRDHLDQQTGLKLSTAHGTSTLCYRQGDNDEVLYIRRTDRSATKIGTRVYIRAFKAKKDALKAFEEKAELIVSSELSIAHEISPPEGDEPEIMAETTLEALARMLSDVDRYRFKVFAPGSLNFGIVLKYRQAWEPQTYQVGELLKTFPLAPNQSQKYSTRTVVKRSRSRKEIDGAVQTRSDSDETTGRAESEIMRRARNTTNFEATAEGKGGIGVVEFGGKATAGVSAEDDSTRNKKRIREAVQKAAHEYKQERKVEISIGSSQETETTESGEISNQNEEITVTYLFYELQKRFHINEQLVDIEPVILVGHDVPLPGEITDSWLIRHDWILRRVLLDDSFAETFELLKESDKARDLTLGVLAKDLVRKIEAFDLIKEQVAANTRVKEATNAALKNAVGSSVAALNAELEEGEVAGDVALTVLTGGLFGSQGLLGVGGTSGYGGDIESSEAAEHRQEATEEMLARTVEEARRLASVLEGAEVALESAIKKYTAAIRERLNKELAVLRLRTHVAQNILYYMQSIWEYEPSDQRFFRMYDVRVPAIGGDVGVEIGEHKATLTFSAAGARLSNTKLERLADVADLDQLLGYKGNYLMFPLREHNYVTAWMAQDYLDGGGQVRDPQTNLTDVREATAHEASLELEVLNAMSVELDAEIASSGELENPTYKAARSSLRHQIKLTKSRFADVVVPTDLLFIEALPGAHPLLEDFKLGHRETDLQIARLEQIRREGLLLSGDYEDPDIDKSISLKGAPATLQTEV